MNDKKNLQIHVRLNTTTRKQWDELCESSDLNTQSALFRRIVSEITSKNDAINKITAHNES